MQQSLADALQPVNWPVLVLVSARVGGTVMIAPLWSQGMVPGTLRGAIAVVLSLALLPSVPPTNITIEGFAILTPLATELLLGLAIGLSATVFLAAVAVASEVISLQMGLSLGAALGGMPELGPAGIGQLQGQFSMALYVAIGGHLALIEALHRSFATLPPGAPVAWNVGARTLLSLAGQVFPVALEVAAPVMVALLITNVGLAILNRAVPQLNTMMVAVPVTVGAGLVTLGLTLPYFATIVGRWAMSIGSDADIVIRALTPAVVH